MSLKDINFEDEYRIPRDNVIDLFFIPSLKESYRYERSVGYFSSDSLIQLSYGLCELVKNGGKIKIIASPNLSADDYEAINKGYEKRETIIENALIKCLFTYDDYFKKERLNLITDLIANDILDIKIAFSYNEGNLGLYHEKMGLMYDNEDNVVAFSGSMNETKSGLTENYETIDIFTSWEDSNRVAKKQLAFKNLWNDSDKGAIIFEFPKAVKKELLKNHKNNANYNIDEEEKEKILEEYNKRLEKIPHIPSYIKIRDYQKQAILNWSRNNYVGIFDMATGTGKTITGISAIINLLENLQMKLGIIICVPYQHLVDQWTEELLNFNFKPIIAYSSSLQRSWKKRFKKEIFEYSKKVRDNFCLITTNATFSTKFIQENINKCDRSLLLVVDEAHNFGSPKLLNLLNENLFQYRLALSATFERHNDEVGTSHLMNFFQTKCIEYTMSQAINDGMLCKYYYYPIPIYLDNDELDEYNELSLQIKKAMKYKENGDTELTELAKRLLIKRSRIIARARNKVKVLKEKMIKYKNDNYILVYCGATNYYDINSDEDDSIKQIYEVQRILNQELEMNCLQFTSMETSEERQLITEEFKRGNSCQVLVAIKCLDEGVNIPNIKTVFILASSTNPKEYIQRRGRVLRKAEGKDFATIHDFITLPRDLNSVKRNDEMDYDESLIKRELSRLREFSELSINPQDSDRLIDDLFSVYGGIVYEEEGSELL